MRMIQVDPATKEIRRPVSRLGLLILTASEFINPAESLCSNIPAQMASCFQSGAIVYEDFLHRNFDGSFNSTNPLAQIYLSSKSGNESYINKEMLQQPDKDKFLEAMVSEVGSMPKDKIWELVPHDEMVRHYNKQRKEGVSIDRQKIMMI